MSLENCIEKLSAALADFDTNEIVRDAKEYRTRGMSAREAELKAIDDHLAALRAEQNRILGKVSEQYAAENPPPKQAEEPAAPEKKPKASTGEKNTVFTKDKADEALAKLKAAMGRLNSGLDPELIQLLVTRGGFHVERGVRSFAEWAKEMVDEVGNGVKPYLKWLYKSIADYPGFDAKGMDDLATLPEIETLFKGGEPDVSTGREYAQPYSKYGEPETLGDVDAIQDEPGAADVDTGAPGESVSESRLPQQSDLGVSEPGPAAGGKRGDQPVREQGGLFDFEPAGTDERGGRAEPGVQGVASDRRATEQAAADAARGHAELGTKREQQAKAANLPVIRADLKNIKATLPYLMDAQHDDVLKAENRLEKGAGMLFTNGTGTGKTYTGLGIINRHIRLTGDDNILVVVPSQPKVTDWIEDAHNLDVPLTALANKKDSGKGPVVTTYANFRDNWWTTDRDYSLIVYDESHYLKSASDTEALNLQQHRAIARHPRGLYDLAWRRDPAARDLEMARRKFVQDAVDQENKTLIAKYVKKGFSADDARDLAEEEMSDQVKTAIKKKANKKYHDAHATEFKEAHERARETAKGMAERYPDPAKVVFLSATPFPYHFSLDYAEGFLFDYGQREGRGYNDPDGRDAFYMTNLGYRKRVGKLTRPDAEVDQGLMERQLAERMKKEGVMSGRMLDTGHDYSREFVKYDDELGKQIDRGFHVLQGYAMDSQGEWKHDKRYRLLPEAVRRKFTHTYMMQLREGIGARNVADRIEKHLKLGRKVVVFHDYRAPPSSHPFQFGDISVGNRGGRDNEIAAFERLKNEIELFETENPDLISLPLSSLKSVVDEIGTKYGKRAAFINGTETPKAKDRAKAAFNNDASGVDIIVVQRLSGREGISLHDLSGKKQRTLIDLGLPTAPVDAIQTEGRINRLGMKTDAIVEYPVLHTSFERYGFFSKVSERSSTAENLAMGDLARGLKMSFRQSYQDYSEGDPHAGQGKGGMAMDRALAQDSPYKIAIGLYYGTFSQKGKTRNQRAGKDYYATPEPVGFKMVEWGGLRSGDDVLEPSAGHGAIARFFPDNVSATAIEPEFELQDQLQAWFDGKRIRSDFEDHHLVNKYDVIVMNPPFGQGGATSTRHLDKAVKHLREGGRIVALLPEGAAADKAFDKWYEEIIGVYKVAEYGLPPVTFERAGTSVKTKIVILDKWENKDAPHIVDQERREISADTTKELFEKLEHMEAPPRAAKPVEPEKPAAPPPGEAAQVTIEKGTHTKTGADIWYGRMAGRVERDVYDRMNALAKKHGGYYSTYRGGGAKPGFVFKTEAEAKAFEADANGGSFAKRKIVTETDEFKRWYGGSGVVDETGDQLVVDDGRPHDIQEYKSSQGLIWFTDRKGLFKDGLNKHENAVYLAIENPLDLYDARSAYDVETWREIFREQGLGDAADSLRFDSAINAGAEVRFGYLFSNIDAELNGDSNIADVLQNAGYDGILAPSEISETGTDKTFVAFHPNQIKSATGNNGEFDPNNPDITFAKRDTDLAREPYRWSEVLETEKGPSFIGEDVSLFPIEKFPNVWRTTGYAVLDENGQRIGSVVLRTDGDQVTDLYWLTAYNKRSGMGTRVMRTLTANNDASITIHSILPESAAFWESIGATNHTEGEQPDATIDWRSHATATGLPGLGSEARRSQPAANSQNRDSQGEAEEAQATRAYLETRAGRRAIAEAIDSGRLKIMRTDSPDAPMAVQRATARGDIVFGYHDPVTEIGYLFSDNLNQTGRRADPSLS